MARKKLEEVAKQDEKKSLQGLKELIDDFGSQNDKLKALKKTCEDQNTKIKEVMNELVKPDEDGTRKMEGDGYIAVLSVRDKSVMNEEKLIAWLKKKGLSKGGACDNLDDTKARRYGDSNRQRHSVP